VCLPLFINNDGASLSHHAKALDHRIDDAMRESVDDAGDDDEAS
jgi:hypothetical protein